MALIDHPRRRAVSLRRADDSATIGCAAGAAHDGSKIGL
jgi:hypothetical protein